MLMLSIKTDRLAGDESAPSSTIKRCGEYRRKRSYNKSVSLSFLYNVRPCVCVLFPGHVQVRKLECLNAYGRNNTSDAIKYYENTIYERNRRGYYTGGILLKV